MCVAGALLVFLRVLKRIIPTMLNRVRRELIAASAFVITFMGVRISHQEGHRFSALPSVWIFGLECPILGVVGGRTVLGR